MAKKSKRQKTIKRLNLSDHTLDINIRRCNYNKFNFSEIEDYVRELVGSGVGSVSEARCQSLNCELMFDN